MSRSAALCSVSAQQCIQRSGRSFVTVSLMSHLIVGEISQQDIGRLQELRMRLDENFFEIKNVVPPESPSQTDMLLGLSDKELIAYAGPGMNYAMETFNRLPATMRREVLKKYVESPFGVTFQPYAPPLPWENPRGYVAIVNTMLSFQMTYDECVALSCTPKWFGPWFAKEDLSLTDCKVWLPQERE